MPEHQVLRSKMKKAGPLLAHPLLAPHVPETVWYRPAGLKFMLDKYRVIYLKPDTWSRGRGIVRLSRLEGGNYELRSADNADIVSIDKLVRALGEVMSAKRNYIMQQGIELATYNYCPLDFRMVLQKPYSTWQLTLTSAKVALSAGAIVTNVAQGARDYPLLDILLNYDQKQDPLAVYRELIDLVHQGANLLGAYFPLEIIGFDMAVDKAGKVWFLEANTNPACDQCKLVNDPLTVQKFEDAGGVIGPIGRRRRKK